MLLAMKLTGALVLLSVTLVFCSQTPSSTQQSPTIPVLPDANPELLQLVIQDQWDRGNDMFGDKQLLLPDLHGKSIEARDEERHAATRKLLAGGKVKSGTDFWLSAIIFQHSFKPEDLMLAHILAVTAAAKGNRNGKWLAAASLDRYLWTINQPQVFGTNFKKTADDKWTNEPFAKETLSDAERVIWCVVPLAEQQRILKDLQEGKPLAPTGTRDCKE
jgi:hypothetical protein